MKTTYLLLLFLLAGCADSIISVPVGGTVTGNRRVFGYYSLPKTALKIQVPISKSSLESSIVKAYDTTCVNEILMTRFGWEPVKSPKEVFTIEEKVLLQPVTLPDPDKTFAITYGKRKSAHIINISLSRNGLIQSGEFAQESKTFEIAKKVTEVAGTLIGASAGLGAKAPPDIKTIRRGCRLSSVKDPRVVNLIENATTLADTRLGLVKEVAANVDNTEILKMHLTEIDALLKSVKDQLTGSLSKKVYYVTLYFEPKPKGDLKSRIPLLSLDPRKGLASTDANVPEEIRTNDTQDAKVLELAIRKLTESKETEIKKHFHDYAGDSSEVAFLFYNLPAKYELHLRFGNKSLPVHASKDQKEGSDDYQVYFPQLGQVAWLPVDFKEANIIYYEDTGGLKSAKFVKNASVDAAKVQGAYEALDSIRSTMKAIKESNNAGNEVEEDEVEEQVIRLIVQNEGTGTGGQQ